MILNLAVIVFGGLCAVYDFTLIILHPGTFLDNLTSFTHIWSLLGGYHIFLGVYRIKKGHSFWQTWKKWLKLPVGSLTIVGALIAIINLGFILTPVVAALDEPADYVILLGGGIDKNGKLPKSVMNRVEKTAEYLQHNEKAICVVTGGTLKWLPYAEAPEIKRQLVARGIEAERVLVEDQALDTIQNFQLSCGMLANERGVSESEILNSKIVVVTTHFHLRRAERLAKRMGFKNIKGIPSKCPAFYIPMSYVREICAYIKLNLRILLTGKPANLLLDSSASSE